MATCLAFAPSCISVSSTPGTQLIRIKKQIYKILDTFVSRRLAIRADFRCSERFPLLEKSNESAEVKAASQGGSAANCRVMLATAPRQHLHFIPLPLWDVKRRGGIAEEVASCSCRGPAELLEERRVVSEH